MRIPARWLFAPGPALFWLGLLVGQPALACHVCKQSPCVVAPPEPTYECMIENVPVTVMKTKTKVDLIPVRTKTILETRLETTYVDQKRTICWPSYETRFVPRTYTVLKPVYETIMVPQPVKLCRPVQTTREVIEYCLKPYTELVPVPVKAPCGSCGHAGGCSCRAVARTCYRMVPVVRTVTETTMVTEIQTQLVPLVQCRMVAEQRTEQVPITTRTMKTEVVAFKVPVIKSVSVPKTLVYKKAVVSCVQIPVTVYRPEMRMVPVVPVADPTPQALPSPQANPSSQALQTLPAPPVAPAVPASQSAASPPLTVPLTETAKPPTSPSQATADEGRIPLVGLSLQ
jgi:hypothetical protein